jgi:UDPglucose 6-dehydrogenase
MLKTYLIVWCLTLLMTNVKCQNFIEEPSLNVTQKLWVFCLVMRLGSDSFRASAIQGIMGLINAKGITVVIFDLTFDNADLFSSKVIKDLGEFK